VIFSSALIRKVSFTQSLIPRVAVIWIKNKSLWALCTRICHMWRVFQKSWNVQGIDTTLGQSSKLNTLWSSLMNTSPERYMQQTAQCNYSIPRECGRNYIGETGRPLAVRLHEHRHNLQHAYANMPMRRVTE
jgi:hypothetical protein